MRGAGPDHAQAVPGKKIDLPVMPAQEGRSESKSIILKNKKMDLVYILGSGSRWQNNEIRFSLRSVEAYLKHGAGRIFIVGSKPDWMQNVIHIEALDGYDNKLKNAVHKLREACFDSRLSDEFILMNDDFFFLKPADHIPLYTLGSINEMIVNHSTKGGYYYEAMHTTRTVLQEAGITDPISYEVHFPMVLKKDLFLKMTDSIKWEETGYLFRSIYGNVYNLGGKRRRDCKAYSFNDFKILSTKSELLSTSDHVALCPQFQEWMRKKYPKPSQYENDHQ